MTNVEGTCVPHEHGRGRGHVSTVHAHGLAERLLADRGVRGWMHAYRKWIRCIGFRYTSLQKLGERIRRRAYNRSTAEVRSGLVSLQSFATIEHAATRSINGISRLRRGDASQGGAKCFELRWWCSRRSS